MFNKHRNEAWLSKFDALRIEALHKMLIERCETCHETTKNRIRIEVHETLMSNAKKKFNTHESLPKELETHRGKVD